MIDFTKLVSPKEVVVPILQNQFQYQRKKYQLSASDGWWIVTITGNKAEPKEPYFWLDSSGSSLRWISGYTYNNQIIFSNFDIARKNFGSSLTAPLFFNTVDTFSSVKAVLWETDVLFYTGINYNDFKIYEIKSAFDNEQSLESLKGVTPELRSLYLFHSLERDQIREAARQIELKENDEKKMRETPYRLGMTLNRAGAKLISYSQSGDRLIVEWELIGGKHTYNSVIDCTTWMVVEAGYCLSGGDKKLNLTSLAKTAEEYEERDVIFITRH